MTSPLVDSHLDVELDVPRSVEEMLLPDVYVGLEIDLLSTGDGIVTDRHHASADRYESDDPMNQIEGQRSRFTLSWWLRYGCERVYQAARVTACHPSKPNVEDTLTGMCDRESDFGSLWRPQLLVRNALVETVECWRLYRSR